ncbi:MAG: recombinase family protein [Deltaproteobacteria bacterium]|nr:recombinase family protein [Deltaproteobacteria bacterium]
MKNLITKSQDPMASTAAIYARTNTADCRLNPIEDQIAACRQLAARHGLTVLDHQIFVDEAISGQSRDREALLALSHAAKEGCFQTLLVEDIARIAGNSHFLFNVMAELDHHGVRILATDGFDSTGGSSTALLKALMDVIKPSMYAHPMYPDLGVRTKRGMEAQKRRGYSVGERAYGYTTVPGDEPGCGAGRLRSQGSVVRVLEEQAVVVRRIFEEYASGRDATAIVGGLNEDGITAPGGVSRLWVASTVRGMLRNEKYTGRWVWNKTAKHMDPLTGMVRVVPQPESEWVVMEQEALRIVPQEIWNRVRKIEAERCRTGKEGGHRKWKPLTQACSRARRAGGKTPSRGDDA